MEADGSESLIKSEMDSGRNMNNSNNNALGAVGVSIPFPEDLLGVPQDSLNGAGAVSYTHLSDVEYEAGIVEDITTHVIKINNRKYS